MKGEHPGWQPSVLLAFRAENVRSFRDELEFSMLATGMAEEEYVRQIPWREGGEPLNVLAVAGVFGANASGKSNLLKVIADMASLVRNSFRSGDPEGGIPRTPFALDPACRSAPSRYEIDVVLEGVRHEYGFVIDDERVLEEWAYHYPKGRASRLFHREGDSVKAGAKATQKSEAVKELIRPNALFLSTAGQALHPALLPLFRWFSRNLLLAEENSRASRQAFTTDLLEDGELKENVLALLRVADLGVVGARKHPLDADMHDRLHRAVRIILGQESDSEVEGPTFEELGVRLEHSGVGGETIEFDPEEESLGTRVWFGLAGPVMHALHTGAILLADELDTSLHPILVAQVVRLFQDPETNPRRAQLLFNSHDPTLLGDSGEERLLGRDQIWYTEKDHDGSTRLYSLADLHPRKREAIGKRYMEGRYGAVPILSHQEFSAALGTEEAAQA